MKEIHKEIEQLINLNYDWGYLSKIFITAWDMIDMLPFLTYKVDYYPLNIYDIMDIINTYIFFHKEHPVYNYIAKYPDIFVNNNLFFTISGDEFFSYCEKKYPTIHWKTQSYDIKTVIE